MAEALTREGWSVWWDRDIPPGKSFDRVIERELGAARCVIVLWSKASVESEWVRAEASDAMRRGLLLVVGGLYYFHGLPPGSEPGAAPTSEPPRDEPGVRLARGTIPVLSAKVTALRFFEGASYSMPPRRERVYRSRFARPITRNVFCELGLEHPPGQRVDFRIQAVYTYDDGSKVHFLTNYGVAEMASHILPDWEGSSHALGPQPFSSAWAIGTYLVVVYVNGDKVAAGSFSIDE